MAVTLAAARGDVPPARDPGATRRRAWPGASGRRVAVARGARDPAGHGAGDRGSPGAVANSRWPSGAARRRPPRSRRPPVRVLVVGDELAGSWTALGAGGRNRGAPAGGHRGRRARLRGGPRRLRAAQRRRPWSATSTAAARSRTSGWQRRRTTRPDVVLCGRRRATWPTAGSTPRRRGRSPATRAWTTSSRTEVRELADRLAGSGAGGRGGHRPPHGATPSRRPSPAAPRCSRRTRTRARWCSSPIGAMRDGAPRRRATRRTTTARIDRWNDLLRAAAAADGAARAGPAAADARPGPAGSSTPSDGPPTAWASPRSGVTRAGAWPSPPARRGPPAAGRAGPRRRRWRPRHRLPARSAGHAPSHRAAGSAPPTSWWSATRWRSTSGFGLTGWAAGTAGRRGRVGGPAGLSGGPRRAVPVPARHRHLRGPLRLGSRPSPDGWRPPTPRSWC